MTIELSDVAKRYRVRGRPLPVLSDVNLSLPSGSLTLLHGPSGAGKSTLLGIIGAMTRATSGRVVVAGEEISALPERFLSRFRRERIGFVFQGFHLIERLTAVENLALAFVPTAVPVAERRNRIARVLDRFGLTARADFRAVDLSGGERQRLAGARAFLMDPAVLLADEPVSNLDQDAAAAVLAALENARDQGRTVIIAAHTPLALSRRADFVFRIENGRLLALQART